MLETYVQIPEKRESTCLFGISSATIARVTVFLPVFGFIFSILWSYFFKFEITTWTHCRVRNLLPSISAAFNYPPASVVWRICIAFHSAPRFLVVASYYHYNRRRRMKQTSIFSRYQGPLARFAAFANVAENMSLVVLTNITSGDNKFIHVVGFISFVISSVLYLSTTCLMHSVMSLDTEGQRRSWKWKKRSCAVNFIALAFAMFFYHRHNAYCEPYVYTFFALSEYVVVLSNMAFHYSASYEFDEYTLKFEKEAISKLY